MEVLLDGRMMVSREVTHDLLSDAFGFPGYYGRNLDALYDLLTEGTERREIVLIHGDAMLDHLGAYGKALLKTLVDASCASENVELCIRNEII